MILVIGPSGQGKSSSIRNLPVDKTLIINCERKFLPFQDALKFKQKEPDNAVVCESDFNAALANKDVEIIVEDSLTKYIELVLQQSKTINKGYDIYNFLNDKITQHLEKHKKNNDKFVVMTAIDERVEFMKDSGSAFHSRRCWCAGKQWEGKIEKEFTIVLFTDIKAEKGKDSEYRFITNNDGTHSAKSPKGMFDLYIPNDLNLVINRIKEFYGIKKIILEEKKDLVPQPPNKTMLTEQQLSRE